MCSQFTPHHKFRISSGRSTFRQGKTDGILYSRESHVQGSQGAPRAWFGKPRLASHKKVEKAPGYGVLGRYTACSTCRQIHLTRHFLMPFTLHNWCAITVHGSSVCMRVIPSSCHPWWAFDRPFLVASSICLSPCFYPSFTSSLSHSTCTLTCTPSSMWRATRETPAAPPPTEESCPLAGYTPHTCYEPQLLDDFHYSKTSAMIFQDESGDIDTEPSYSCDVELDDEILSSPLFIQEWEEPANLRQTCQSHEQSLLPAQRKSSREMENERIRILLERQKEQILADVRTEIQKHEFQADSERRSIQELNGIIESQRKRDRSTSCRWRTTSTRSTTSAWTITGTKSGSSWGSSKKSLRDGRFEAISRVNIRWIFEKKIDRKSGHCSWTHGQNSGTTEWSQLCEWFERCLKMLNQYAVDHPTLPVNPRYSHLFAILAECKAVLWKCRAATISRQVFGTRMVYREAFL